MEKTKIETKMYLVLYLNLLKFSFYLWTAGTGICGLYERKLKDLNPAIRNITYDIADLYNFIDGLADMSALVYAAFSFSLFSLSLAIYE